MTRQLLRLLVLGLPLVAATSSPAALNPAIVPADARWVVHVDFNSLRDSVLGTQLADMLSQVKHEAGPGEIQLNIPKILETAGSATAYGVNLFKDPNAIDGVLVLQGKPDLRKIAEGMVAQLTVAHPENVTELKDLPFEAYEFKGGLSVAFPPEPIVLLSKSRTHLAKARDTYRGAAASLASSASPLKALLPKFDKPYLMAASVVPAAEGLPGGDGPHARILRMANAGCLALGEDGEMTAARIQLVADSEAMADKITKIMQGVAAMLSLAQSDDQQLNEFLQSVEVVREKASVHVALAYPTVRLAEMIKSIQKQHAPSGPEDTAEVETVADDPHFPDAEAGAVVGRWLADQQLGGDAPTPDNFAVQTLAEVELARGSLVTLCGRRQAGENARFDYVEFTPIAGAGESLRYEAEYMRLMNYRVEQLPFASGGELIIITGDRGSARFQFQGAGGRYRVAIGYVDESDGKSTFAMSIRNPETPAGPEKTAP